MFNKKLMEIEEFTDEGYRPVIDYQSWRVAILNYIDELEVESIYKFDRHNETDEVFVLLSGKCILFIADGQDEIGKITAIDMEPKKIYNVKKGVWHTHTLDKGGSTLIVENRDTSEENSDSINISDQNKKEIINKTKNLW